MKAAPPFLEPRRWLLVSLAAGLYLIAAQLGRWTALAPHAIPLLWAPAGLALAALVLGGWPMGLGIAAGAFLASLSLGLPAAAGLALGAVLPAGLSTWAIRRWVGELPPPRVRLIGRVLLITALTSLLAAGLAAVVRYWTGAIGSGQAVTFLWMGWIGDYAGVLLVAPALISAGQHWQRRPAAEPLIWPLASLMAGLTLVVFAASWEADDQRLAQRLHSDSSEMLTALATALRDDEDALHAVQTLYSLAHGQIESAEFAASIRPALQYAHVLRTLAWAPRVPADEQAAFEEHVRAQGLPQFQITQRGAAGEAQPAAGRAEYFPLTWIEPAADLALAGWDLNADPGQQAAIQRAAASGQFALTGPVALGPEAGQPADLLVILPVFASGAPSDSTAGHPAALAGLAVGLVRLTDLLPAALASLNPHDIELTLFDITGPQPQPLAFWPTPPGQSGPAAGDLASLQVDPFAVLQIDVYGRTWLAVARPGPFYTAEARGWGAWLTLAAGLILTSVFLVFVAVRRQGEARLREAERQYRTLVEQSPAIVYIDEFGANWRYLSPQIETILGYPPADFLEQRVFWKDLIDPQDLDEFNRLAQTHLRAGARLNTEFRVRARDGRLVWLRDESEVTRDSVSGAWLFRGVMYDITERKQAEAALRIKDQAIASSINALAMAGLDGRLTYVNPAFLELWGYASEDRVLGRASGEFWRWPAQVGDVMSALRTTRGWSGELSAQRADGTVFEAQASANLVLDAAGEPLALLAAFTDITERNRAEAALREAQALYQTVFDVSLDGLAVFDAHFKILLINQRGAEMAGYADPAEMRGLSIMDLVVAGDRPRLAREVPQQLAAGMAHGAYRARRRDGTAFAAEYALIQVPGGAAQAGALLIGVTRDVTARQREAALQATQFAVTRLLVAAPSLADAAPELLRILAEGLGWQAGVLFRADGQAGVLHRAAAWHTPEPDVEALAAELRETAVAPGQGLVGQVWAEGRPLWLEDRRTGGPPERPDRFADLRAAMAFPLLGESQTGGVIALYQQAPRPVEPDVLAALDSVSRQISLFMARRRAEETLAEERNSLARRVEERTADLTRANAELAHASRLKDEFLSSMSHELRTPLNGILSLSESLAEGVYGQLTPQQLAPIRSMAEAGEHLLELINDILDLSKIEAGKLELQLAPVDLEAVCQASLRLVRQPAQHKQLQVTFTLQSGPAGLLADERRLKQMLVNLLGNAVKFTPAGGRVGLEVTEAEAGRLIRFVVWDTGIGIAPEKQALLFQPFTQVDSSLARQYSGTGLGLALVRRLAELHGGGVGVDSVPGQGSRFYFDLPAVPTEPVEPAPPSTTPLRLRSALIVDDSRTAGDQLARYLRELGAEVTVALEGTGVVERAAAGVDVILLDLLLPGPSGWEVLAALKADPRTRAIPVIITSVVEELARGLAAGAAEYLVKPTTRAALHTALRRVLAEPAAPSEPAPADPAAPLILLAEDNPINQGALSDFLTAKGYRMVLAGNGREALERAAEFRPDVILMDVQMPQMDGLEAIRRLRAQPAFARTPIVALTALAMPGDRERCLAAGASDYLTKPVSLKALANLVADLLRS